MHFSSTQPTKIYFLFCFPKLSLPNSSNNKQEHGDGGTGRGVLMSALKNIHTFLFFIFLYILF